MLNLTNAQVILPDGILSNGCVRIEGDRIAYVGTDRLATSGPTIDLEGAYLSPGFVDIHIHGACGADFMDATQEAFQTVCRGHAAHGTTALTPTTCVASQERHLQFFQWVRHFRSHPTGGAKIVGAHFYGPYFADEARGCHPRSHIRPPTPEDYEPYFAYSDDIRTATVAPELPGAEAFVRACCAKGIRCNAGHSWATFDQMQQAVEWGVRHIDHLFCAMSDRARLRQFQTYPMRGGVMEATLYFDELTTEVIADGKHLQGELLKLAYKIKGSDKLALVTDASRAVDMPDGHYVFGPLDDGEPFRKQDGVGVTPDGTSLASSVVGMDHCVRTFHRLTGVPLHEVIKMASLTPARIIGLDQEIGSIAVGKAADLIVLDREWNVKQVYINGQHHRSE